MRFFLRVSALRAAAAAAASGAVLLSPGAEFTPCASGASEAIPPLRNTRIPLFCVLFFHILRQVLACSSVLRLFLLCRGIAKKTPKTDREGGGGRGDGVYPRRGDSKNNLTPSAEL